MTPAGTGHRRPKGDGPIAFLAADLPDHCAILAGYAEERRPVVLVYPV